LNDYLNNIRTFNFNNDNSDFINVDLKKFLYDSSIILTRYKSNTLPLDILYSHYNSFLSSFENYIINSLSLFPDSTIDLDIKKTKTLFLLFSKYSNLKLSDPIDFNSQQKIIDTISYLNNQLFFFNSSYIFNKVKYNDDNIIIKINYNLTKASALINSSLNELRIKNTSLLLNNNSNFIFYTLFIAFFLLLSSIIIFYFTRNLINDLHSINISLNSFFEYLNKKRSKISPLEINRNDEIGQLMSCINENLNKNLIYEYTYNVYSKLPNKKKFLLDQNNFNSVAFVKLNNFHHLINVWDEQVIASLLVKISSFISINITDLKFNVYHIDDDTLLFAFPDKFSTISSFIEPTFKSVNLKSFFIDSINVEIPVTTKTIFTSFINENTLNDVNSLFFTDSSYNCFIPVREISIDSISPELVTLILDGLKNKEFVPFFQGIVDNSTRKIIKYETLIRLKHDGKIITPNVFLEASKKLGVYSSITILNIEKTFSVAKDNPSIDFTINLTYEDILNKKIMYFILLSNDKFNVASQITFEITESEQLDSFDLVRDFVSQLNSNGFKTAIDDFGSGFSNFETLLSIPFDFLKIDGSLISNIHNDSKKYNAVKAIVSLAKSLDMKIIAEFVESEQEFDILLGLGVDFTQGYLFHSPSEFIVKIA
jgi:EAL domain-containing protein (putative c-di-GMP-specific phosphodiesterase class I)